MPTEITRTHYVAALYKGGRRVGMIEEFETLAQAREHYADTRTPNGGRSGVEVHEFEWRDVPPDRDIPDGVAIIEVRHVFVPGGPHSGTRIYA